MAVTADREVKLTEATLEAGSVAQRRGRALACDLAAYRQRREVECAFVGLGSYRRLAVGA